MVSLDSPEKNAEFAKSLESKHVLLSDPTGETAKAIAQRSDVCAVPAAAVVGEAVMSLALADALLERFGGDTIADLRQNLCAWHERLKARLTRAAPPSGV